LLQIIEYYLENYDGDILEKYLLQVDLEYLDKLHSAEIISGYIMRGMNRKAYEAIKRFGYGDVEISRLLRLASYIVTDTDILGDEALTSLCIYLYQKGQYNDRIIQYLVFQYKADTRELSRLWETAMVVLGEARELEENILAQLIFSDTDLYNAMDVFQSYYRGHHRGMVTKAFLKKMAYQYFIREEWVPDSVFDYLMLEMKNGEIQDDISHGAVLWHLSKSVRLNDEQSAYAIRTVKQFLNPPEVLAKEKEKKNAQTSAELKYLVERLRTAFKTKVSLIGTDKKGRIYIDYYTRDDLDRICELLDIIDRQE